MVTGAVLKCHIYIYIYHIMWSYKAIKVQHSKSDVKTIDVYENEVSAGGKKTKT